MVALPHCWTAATCVALMLLPMLFSAACSSIVFGIISDKTSRRKPIVIAAGNFFSPTNIIQLVSVVTIKVAIRTLAIYQIWYQTSYFDPVCKLKVQPNTNICLVNDKIVLPIRKQYSNSHRINV